MNPVDRQRTDQAVESGAGTARVVTVRRGVWLSLTLRNADTQLSSRSINRLRQPLQAMCRCDNSQESYCTARVVFGRYFHIDSVASVNR